MSAQQVVEEYLGRFERAAAVLPRGRRGELVDEIRAHLAEAVPPGATESDARNAIERLGSPEAIVVAGLDGPAPHDTVRTRDWVAVLLVLLGGVVIPVIGWIVGVVLLWSSRAFEVRHKLVGTLVPPGGLSAAAFLAFGVSGSATGCVTTSTGPADVVGAPAPAGPEAVTTCTGGGSGLAGSILLAVIVIASVATAAYLGVRLQRAQRLTAAVG